MANSDTVVLLTTWNRPALLAQALSHITREAALVGAPVVVVDDKSDNRQTLAILSEARARGTDVVTREWARTEYDNPHYATGFNAEYAFRYALDKYDPEFVIKVDDDIVLGDFAFAKLRDSYDAAVTEGCQVLACSGLQGIYEDTTMERDYWRFCLVATACAACCLYPAYYMRHFLDNTPLGEVGANGWDHAYLDYRNKWHPNGVFANTYPKSVAFHAGFSGVHLSGVDINRKNKFDGSIEGVVTN